MVVKIYEGDTFSAYYFEDPWEGYSSNATANTGESYISYDAVYWDDLTEQLPGTDLCIKAFTYTSQNDTGAAQAADHAAENYKTNTDDGILSIASDDVDDNSGTVAPGIKPDPSEDTSTDDGMVFPAKFDLRALSLLSPVRDQGQWNTCWAHAMCSSLESYDLRLDRSGGNTGTDPEKITLSRDLLSLIPDTSYTLGKNIFPLSAINEPVKWISSDNNVAAVDENGTIYAVGSGSATITAELDNVTACCSVFVYGGESCVITGADASALQPYDDGSLSGKVSVTVAARMPLDITAMLAIYNEDGTLAGISTVNTRLEENENTISFDDINIREVRGICKKKLMIWNSIDNMRPLADALDIR